jgi:anti-sigma factor RsiW
MAAGFGAASAGLCEDARRRASMAVDGELDDEIGVRLLRRHLAGCPDCARRFAEMLLVSTLLRRAPLEPVPRGLRSVWRRRVRASAETVEQSRGPSRCGGR